MSYPIALDVSVCDQRRGYRAYFSDEDQALAFIADRSQGGRFYPQDGRGYGNHDFHEVEDLPINEAFGRLIDRLYPQCSHGMDKRSCYGPQHYYYDEYEQAAGHFNSGPW